MGGLSSKTPQRWCSYCPALVLQRGHSQVHLKCPVKADMTKHKTGGVAARPGQAVNEAAGDWIGNDREHNRHGAGDLHQSPYDIVARCYNDIRRERDQFRRLSTNLSLIGRSPVDVHPHVAAIDPTQFLQRLSKRVQPGLIVRIVLGYGQKSANEPHPLALLRAGDNRASSSRPTEKYDELAPPHCLPRSSGHAIVAAQTWIGKDPAHVRFASLADIQA